MKLSVIVGHEEIKPGVKGVFPIDCHEYHYNKDLSVDIYRFARDLNIDCRIFLRDGIGRLGVSKQVNEWIGDDHSCSIELHLNAYDKKTRGTETLYIAHNLLSRSLADCVQSQMVKALRSSATHKQNRGIKLLTDLDRGYLNMRDIKCPSCLVEAVFVDNVEEARLLHSKRLEYAKSLAVGALEFLNKGDKIS